MNPIDMPAGRRLDAVIAARVMGWVGVALLDVPHYSISIHHAWDVVGAMRQRGFRFSLTDQPGTTIRSVGFFNDAEYGALIGEDTDALAICHAALAALAAAEEP